MRALVILALAAIGCGGAEKPSPPASATANDVGGVVEDLGVVNTAVPEVCGHKEGDVFCDHELMGYVRVGETSGLASTSAYGTFKLTDALAKSTRKYVYVFASAYW